MGRDCSSTSRSAMAHSMSWGEPNCRAADLAKSGDGAHLIIGRAQGLRGFGPSPRCSARESSRPDRLSTCRHRILQRRARSPNAAHRAHDRDTPPARHRIGAERDARRLRRHHVLEDDGRRTRYASHSMLAAIGQNPVTEGRAPDVEYPIGCVSGRNIQKALELTGKRLMNAILVARRRAHRNRFTVRTEIRRAAATIAARTPRPSRAPRRCARVTTGWIAGPSRWMDVSPSKNAESRRGRSTAEQGALRARHARAPAPYRQRAASRLRRPASRIQRVIAPPATT